MCPEQVTDEANHSESVNIDLPCDQLAQTSDLTSQSAHPNSDRRCHQSTLERFAEKLDQIQSNTKLLLSVLRKSISAPMQL
jgi:hypothetical protein